MNHLALTYSQRTIWLISFVTIIKLILGAWMELNNDEAYYFTYAKQLQWNYFDHPPLVAVLLKPLTVTQFFHHEFFLRIPFIFLGAGSCWLLFLIGKLLGDEYTGFLTASLFMASLYGNFLGGMLVLPDAPLLFFWLLAVYLLLRVICKTANGLSTNTSLWLTGVIIGLAMLSKAQGIFIWIGLGGYLVFSGSRLLKNPYLYLGVCISIMILAPAINWSLDNRFSNYNYHNSRLQFISMKPLSFLKEAVGEIAYTNPVVTVLIFFALLKLKSILTDHTRNGIRFLLWSAFPLMFIVQGISLFNDTLPHWNGPAYCTLLPIAALYIRQHPSDSVCPKPIQFALGLLAAGLIIIISLVKAYPGSLGNGKMPALGKDDVSLDMCGWRSFAEDYTNRFGASPTTVLTDYWFPAGHLKFYLPSQCNVMAVGPLQNIHHFAWTNPKNYSLKQGEDALYISVSNYFSPPGPFIQKAFQSIALPVSIPQWRNGKVIRYFYVYRLCNYLGGIPANGVVAGN